MDKAYEPLQNIFALIFGGIGPALLHQWIKKQQ
jgi:hypothetical protein